MKTEAFQNGDVKSVTYCRFHQRFRPFSVDDRQKRIKTYAFPNQNAFVWKDENDTNTLVWIKTFCFVFFETKTETFENALVWPGP